MNNFTQSHKRERNWPHELVNWFVCPIEGRIDAWTSLTMRECQGEIVNFLEMSDMVATVGISRHCGFGHGGTPHSTKYKQMEIGDNPIVLHARTTAHVIRRCGEHVKHHIQNNTWPHLTDGGASSSIRNQSFHNLRIESYNRPTSNLTKFRFSLLFVNIFGFWSIQTTQNSSGSSVGGRRRRCWAK